MGATEVAAGGLRPIVGLRRQNDMQRCIIEICSAATLRIFNEASPQGDAQPQATRRDFNPYPTSHGHAYLTQSRKAAKAQRHEDG
jgi:hypothetical protein